MLSIKLKIDPYSKPRGALGKFGNITHSSGDYRQWQNKFKTKLGRFHPDPFPNFFCLIYVFKVTFDKKGRKQDLDNMVGAINDSLTPYWIKDDSYAHIPRYWVEFDPGIVAESTIQIYICKDPIEFVGFFINRFLIKRIDEIMTLCVKLQKRYLEGRR